MANKRKESDLYSPALEFLNTRPGTKAWLIHNNAVWFPTKNGGFWKRKKAHEDSIPDIGGIKRKSFGRLTYGQGFMFEIKKEGETASQEQIDWMRKYAECGGIGFIVDTLQDIEEAWEEI